MRVVEDFGGGLGARWRVTESGQGRVQVSDHRLALHLLPTGAGYSNAQIDDYRPQPPQRKADFVWRPPPGKADFVWRPPLRLTLRARFSGAPAGTAGFGLWNHPFAPGESGLRPPQAVWFFYGAPPGHIALAQGVPGHGWKAATFDARRWQFWALLPAAPVGVLLMRVPALYNRLWPIGQRALGISERLLDDHLLGDWHSYSLEWRRDGATFWVDGRAVQRAPYAPRGPLGFVAWIDNQYAVVTPQGHLGFGLVDIADQQSLFLDDLSLESLD
ncbi:MAG: hypothetical protein HXY40_16970 [Chloroflexi bacterium]|nr:hypothetical protein [Chloroflexota bacterium]